MKKNKLVEYRKEIDKIDKEIISCYKKRKQIVKKIADYKRKNNIVIYDKKREEEILKRIEVYIKEKKDIKALKEIYNIIFIESKDEQKKSSKKE